MLIRIAHKTIGPFSRLAFRILDRIVPKDSDLWLIGSHQGLIGNPRFFLENLLQDPRFSKVVVAVVEVTPVNPETKKHFSSTNRVRFVKKTSFEGRRYALRASCVFLSHELAKDVWYPIRSLGGRRAIINLWHGIGTKKTWLLKTDSKKFQKKADAFSYLVASSPVDSLAKAGGFRKKLDDIWITGLPRNDFLLKNNMLPSDLARQEKNLDKAIKGRSLVLYAPTWRKYKRHSNKTFEPFPKGLERIIEVLERQKAVLGMRLHPHDEPYFSQLYEKYPGIVSLGMSYYPETQLLLKRADLLVTDYSSIWIDYLLTGKPMIAYWPDAEEYQVERGTIWSLDQIFPGPVVRDSQGLAQEMEVLLSQKNLVEPRHRQMHEFAKILYHAYEDGMNSRRVLDHIAELDGKAPGPLTRSVD